MPQMTGGPASTPGAGRARGGGGAGGEPPATSAVPEPRGERPAEHHLRLKLIIPAAAVLVVVVLVALFLVPSRTDEPSHLASARGSTTTAAPSSTAVTGSTVVSGASAPGATTTSKPPPTTTKPVVPPLGTQPASITLLFAGDLLPHTPLTAQAARYGQATHRPFDFDPMLAPMKPIISGADVAICHMETPVAPDQGHLSGYPAFGGPVELVDAARNAGYDGCSNASNHSLDRGQDGIRATLDRFDLDHLHHAGTARTAAEAAAITMYDVRNVRVAHLSYAYDFNGYRLPAGAPWAANKIDPAKIKADAAKAKALGADLVVVSVHWGTEYDSNPNQYQRDMAAAMLQSPDIDLVIGCHAHVVQPIDQVAGRFVVWGMGNQLANQPEVPRSDGLTAIATAIKDPATGKWKVAGVQGVPTWIEPGTFHVYPVVRTLADPSTSPALRNQLNASYDRSAATILRDHTPGVTVTPKP